VSAIGLRFDAGLVFDNVHDHRVTLRLFAFDLVSQRGSDI
jgi:hypothetical protein